MTLDLERYEGTMEARANAWASMSDADLRRRATTAAHNRDQAELWGLAEAWLYTYGKAGNDVAANTIENYERGIRYLLEAWDGENLLRPQRDAGLAYVRHLERAGYSPGTIQVHLAACRLLYKALRWSGATEARPFLDVRAPADKVAPHEKRDAYQHDEVQQLLHGADLVEAVMILLAAHGALRVAEILQLEWSDIDLPARLLRVRHGKGGRPRTVYLSELLTTALEALKDDQGGEGFVMPFRTANAARYRLQRLAKRAGAPYRALHALRHYSATTMVQRVGLTDAQDHLGHQSLSTTRDVYSKRRDDVRRAAVDKAFNQ